MSENTNKRSVLGGSNLLRGDSGSNDEGCPSGSVSLTDDCRVSSVDLKRYNDVAREHYASGPVQGGDTYEVSSSDMGEMLSMLDDGTVDLGFFPLSGSSVPGVMSERDKSKVSDAFDVSVRGSSPSHSGRESSRVSYITLSSGTRLCSITSLSNCLGMPLRSTTLLLNRLRIPLFHLRGEAFYMERWLDFVLESILSPNNLDFFAPGSLPLARGEGKFDLTKRCTYNDGTVVETKSGSGISVKNNKGRQRTPLDGRRGRVMITDEEYDEIIKPGLEKLEPFKRTPSLVPVLKPIKKRPSPPNKAKNP